MTIDFNPLFHRVLVEPEEEAEKTEGGIILTNPNSKYPKRGKVVKAGQGWQLPNGTIHPMDVKVGDKVMMTHYEEMTLNGKVYYLLKEDDILGIFND